MGGKFKYFHRSCTILLLALVLQSAWSKKKSEDDDRKKLLAQYAAFEEQIKETVTSIFSKLVEENCEKGDHGCDPGEQALLSKAHDPVLISLNSRLDNVEEILKALFSGNSAEACYVRAIYLCRIHGEGHNIYFFSEYLWLLFTLMANSF